MFNISLIIACKKKKNFININLKIIYRFKPSLNKIYVIIEMYVIITELHKSENVMT